MKRQKLRSTVKKIFMLSLLVGSLLQVGCALHQAGSAALSTDDPAVAKTIMDNQSS